MTDEEFRAAFDQHKDAIYRFAWRMTGNDAADDIAQDVFLVLWRQPDRFDPARGSLRAYLLGVARNLTRKRWRDAHRWEEIDEERFVAQPVDVERRETAQIVADAIRALPPLQREALVLAEYEQLSLEDIARIADAEVGTVKSRLHRARENLRRMLAPLKPASAVRSTRYGTAG
ncbi:MAG TPA: RNA polymerase sigma factor [Vicinamibacterales bacterium]|nr:RNA polymerase sigma factor [Vicinamibacterales bacterium]